MPLHYIYSFKMAKLSAKTFFLIFFIAPVGFLAYGQSAEDSTWNNSNRILSYGKKGFVFSDQSGNYLMNLEFRGQFRLAYPTDSDPVTMDGCRYRLQWDVSF